jgi:outer membrane protein assembly factor BamB
MVKRFICGVGAVIVCLTVFSAYSADQAAEFRFRVTRGNAALLWSIKGQGRYVGMQDAIAIDDLDHDGAAEILTNSYDGTSFRTFFRIVSGKSGRVTRSYSLLYPRTFSGIADFDGNGKKDIALNTYFAEVSGDPPSTTGGTYLISILNPDTGRILWNRRSPEAEPGFGSNVVVIPDSNGDAISDLAILSKFESDRLPRIHYVSGRDGKTFSYFNAPAGSSSFFGAAIACTKVNNDAKVDLIVSDILFGPTPTRVEARLWAFNGATKKRIWHAKRSSDSLFGDKAMQISDITSDAIADLVVTSPNQGPAVRGAVHGVNAATGKIIWTRTGSIESGQFGRGLEILQDLTGDGISEIAVGAPANLPPLLAGGVPGHFAILNGKDGSYIVAVEEVLPNRRAFSTHFGIRIRSAGDLNGDGREDLLVAAPGFVTQQGIVAGLIAVFTLN